MLFEEIKASTILHTHLPPWTGGTSTNTGTYVCGVGHVNRESLQETASVNMQSNIWCVLCWF